jgi:tripartite ATP-independent transporter DctP family solute receptor
MTESVTHRRVVPLLLAAVLAVMTPLAGARAQAKHYRFGYDQPHSTGFGIAGDMFDAKLRELSHGTMAIDQFPNAQLGQEPQLLQLLKSGDIDFAITSTANSATISPEAGVLSLHFLFRSDAALAHALADPTLITAVKRMYADTVTGVHALALATLGLRSMYGSKEVHNLADLAGVKVRVQATATEDTLFAAYGAQTVHMPFGSVYTSLQTGVMQLAENGINVYLENKQYEVGPILSLTRHEANNSIVWVSDRLWVSLSDEQKGWVQAAADEVGRDQPAKALALDQQSIAKLKRLGVKVIDDVDISGMVRVASPIEDEMAAKLGPHAVEILKICRALPQ